MRCVMFGGFSGVVKQPKAEIGRGGVPSKMQPSFAELETALDQIPSEVG